MTEVESVRLAHNKIYERCFDLAVGDRLDYRFDAGSPVSFNLHYHRGKDIVYGLDEALMQHADDAFHPRTSARYCIMWTNPASPTAHISYAYTITRR